jgi:hypothetical protein
MKSPVTVVGNGAVSCIPGTFGEGGRGRLPGAFLRIGLRARSLSETGLYAPSEWERRRSQLIYATFQHKRNPFIGCPEFVDAIYEAPAGLEMRLTWRYRNPSLAEPHDNAVALRPWDRESGPMLAVRLLLRLNRAFYDD